MLFTNLLRNSALSLACRSWVSKSSTLTAGIANQYDAGVSSYLPPTVEVFDDSRAYRQVSLHQE